MNQKSLNTCLEFIIRHSHFDMLLTELEVKLNSNKAVNTDSFFTHTAHEKVAGYVKIMQYKQT